MFDVLIEIFSFIFSTYIYLDKKVSLQLIADILETYEFKVVTV